GSRRDALRLTARGALATGITLLTGRITQGAVVATPSETQGPYWVDEKLNRSDIRSAQSGLNLYLTVNVSKLSNGVSKPVSGAYIDIWHCNALGAYSDEAAGAGNPNTLGQTYLRGYQITNSHGIVRFTTIYPGWYTSRTAHIHARVRTY